MLGRMGGGLSLGSCFLLSGLLARMGGPRPTSWAPIGIPLYFFSGLLGRMGDRGLRSRWAPFFFPSFWVLDRIPFILPF